GVPDGRAGEPDDGLDAELGRGPRGVLHLLGGALPYAFGVAVAPDARGQDPLVPLVDRVVADGLPDEMVGDRPDLEVVLLQRLQLARDVGVVGQGLVHLEVVAPAGDLQAVVAPFRGEPADLLDRQVGPLTGEQRDWPGHRSSTGTYRLSSAALFSTAARTRWTHRPSSKDGVGSVPSAMAVRKSLTSWVKVCSYPSPWPGGHQASMYGWPGSVAMIRRNPDSSAGSVWSWNHSSFIDSKSKYRLPSEPLISMRSAFLRPEAKRVASKEARPPPVSRPMNRAASSTVTGPRSRPPLAARPDDASASGRSLMNVSVMAETPARRCPVMNATASMMWAPMSPSAPEPALSFCSRHTSGNSGSTIQSCRYWARTWRISPIFPSATSRRASATAGTRR